MMNVAGNCKNCSRNRIVSSMSEFFTNIFGEVKDNWSQPDQH
jgi:hypothetical protein